jgi:hypothetical protein
MNARLEPRIVAARTHFSDDFGQGVVAAEARITPSSHGERSNVVILAYA